MADYKIVLGSLFGGEGKGATINWLCKKAQSENKSCAVVRYSNGPQSRHTVVEKGIRHVYSSFGSGTTVGCPTIYQPGVLMDPVCYTNEYKMLATKGIFPVANVGPFCKVISPYDVIANRTDKTNMAQGSTGKGVYKAKSRGLIYYFYNIMGDGNRCEDFFEATARWYNIKRIPKVEELYKNAFLFVWAQFQMNKELKESNYDTLIYEGTQGLLLDADKGFLPYVTATSVIPKLESFPKGTEVYLVCRSYLFRHGNHGNELKMRELPSRPKFDYTNCWNKYQGLAEKGVFDIDLLAEAFKRHNLSKYDHVKYNLIITHCDEIDSNFEYIVHGVVRQGSLSSFVEAIRSNVEIPFDHIYTNDKEESNITLYQ